MAAFCDANILWSPDKKLMVNKVQTALKLGFDILVSNYEVADLQTKKAKKNKDEPMISATDVRIPSDVLAKFAGPNRKVEQYTRCTAILADAAQTTRMNNSKDFRDYDIIAVSPTCEKTFQLACGTLEADIISLDFTSRLNFSMKRSQINLAISRGIHFEICYAPAIRDASMRRSIISNALNLISVCKGKNVIISSACKTAIEVRSPYDAANLGILFGMTPEQTKAAVSLNCRRMLLRAKSRKTANTVLSLEQTCELESTKSTEEKDAMTKNRETEANRGSPQKRPASDDPLIHKRKKKKKKT